MSQLLGIMYNAASNANVLPLLENGTERQVENSDNPDPDSEIQGFTFKIATLEK